MSFYEVFGDMYVKGLTSAEFDEVRQFARDLQRAKVDGNEEKVGDLLKEAAAQLVEFEAFEKIANLTIHMQKHGDEGQVKAASAVLSKALIGAVALPYIKAGVDKVRAPGQFNESIQQVYKSRPDLFMPDKYDMTMNYFNTLKTFAPDVAKQPMFVQNVLDRFHRQGPALMDLNVLRELASTQSAISDTSSKKSAINPANDLATVLKARKAQP